MPDQPFPAILGGFQRALRTMRTPPAVLVPAPALGLTALDGPHCPSRELHRR